MRNSRRSTQSSRPPELQSYSEFVREQKREDNLLKLLGSCVESLASVFSKPQPKRRTSAIRKTLVLHRYAGQAFSSSGLTAAINEQLEEPLNFEPNRSSFHASHREVREHSAKASQYKMSQYSVHQYKEPDNQNSNETYYEFDLDLETQWQQQHSEAISRGWKPEPYNPLHKDFGVGMPPRSLEP